MTKRGAALIVSKRRGVAKSKDSGKAKSKDSGKLRAELKNTTKHQKFVPETTSSSSSSLQSTRWAKSVTKLWPSKFKVTPDLEDDEEWGLIDWNKVPWIPSRVPEPVVSKQKPKRSRKSKFS